jgi:hypothetical protein
MKGFIQWETAETWPELPSKQSPPHLNVEVPEHFLPPVMELDIEF